MQPRRLALCALALALAAPATPALAAKAKPLPCNQVSDQRDDGAVQPLGLKSPALDVLSADIATGKNEVTAVMRLASAKVEDDHVLRLGAQWNFNVKVNGIGYSFFARWPGNFSTEAPQLVGGLTVGSNRSNPEASFRRVGDTFVWTVSRKAVDGLKKPKQFIYVTSANSGAMSLSADSAFAKPNTKYLDKTRTCVPSK